MTSHSVTIIALFAGLLLVLAGVMFILWMPPAGASVPQQALYLLEHRIESLVYVFSVLLSSVLIAPVVVLLSIRLYDHHPVSSITAGVIFILGIILENVATLTSLSRWTYAIPAAAASDPHGTVLFETLQVLYLAVDFSGVLLVYLAAVIYGIMLRDLHRSSSLLLFTSTALFVFAVPFMFFLPDVGVMLTGGSIVVYGAAYFMLGRCTGERFC